MNFLKHTLLYFIFLFFSIGIFSCQSPTNGKSTTDSTEANAEEDEKQEKVAAADLPLDKIKLPEGFKIEIFAADVDNARSLCRGENGTIFVGNRQGNKVYALRDEDGDNIAEKTYVIAEGLNMPNGVAFRKGSLYVAEVSRILRFDDIEKKLASPPKPVVVYDKLPEDKWHGWKFIAFGPDDKLYVPVGAPCNVCESKDDVYATITRMNPDGSDFEIFAKGIRNSVGFAWHPDTKELWFTNNGRDMLGDEIPNDELNHAAQAGMHFGFPYIHQGDLPDPEFGKNKNASDYTAPVQKLGPHVAALGMRFYTGDMFPAKYRKQIFIAKHGSWNRSKKSGYNVSWVKLNGSKAEDHQIFAEGWLDEEAQEAWGRPVDVLVMPDGAMLVSDDLANVVYRISYQK
jgi:glucose/arabinose dehydrogenase